MPELYEELRLDVRTQLLQSASRAVTVDLWTNARWVTLKHTCTIYHHDSQLSGVPGLTSCLPVLVLIGNCSWSSRWLLREGIAYSMSRAAQLRQPCVNSDWLSLWDYTIFNLTPTVSTSLNRLLTNLSQHWYVWELIRFRSTTTLLTMSPCCWYCWTSARLQKQTGTTVARRPLRCQSTQLRENSYLLKNCFLLLLNLFRVLLVGSTS